MNILDKPDSDKNNKELVGYILRANLNSTASERI